MSITFKKVKDSLVLFLGVPILTIAAKEKKPNVIVILCDDMGYGDVGGFGNPTINTPNLDLMIAEGQKWTSFYSAAPVSTPSRAGLLTGRLPVRSGMASDKRRNFYPDSQGGLPASEITIAETLKAQGYNTACIGKWHLGHQPQYAPNANGFDYYFGLPYSNDMNRSTAFDLSHREACKNPKLEYFNAPLMRNTDIIEQPADQTTLTKRYTEETINFISKNKKAPFFVYLAHSMPHVPLFRSKGFENKSVRGLYGDVVEELDHYVGVLMNYLKKTGLDKNTLVIFTSDNGPWLSLKENAGSAGMLSFGKGGTFEGGMRVPAIFWWPGKIDHKVVMDMSCALDLYPTICNITGSKFPNDRIMDGYDLSPLLFGTGKCDRNELYYYCFTEVHAMRMGAFKCHFKSRDELVNTNLVTTHTPPLLYNVDEDPGEKYNLAELFPEKIIEMQQRVDQHNKTIIAVENQVDKAYVPKKKNNK